MEPREYWRKCRYGFGNWFEYGGSRNPKCAVESSPVNSRDKHDDDYTSRGAIAAHVPLVVTQQCAALTPATPTCRPARLSHDSTLAPWWRAPARIPTRSGYRDATHSVPGANGRLEWRHYCRGCKCRYGRRCAAVEYCFDCIAGDGISPRGHTPGAIAYACGIVGAEMKIDGLDFWQAHIIHTFAHTQIFFSHL
jgi:hypothetical protein